MQVGRAGGGSSRFRRRPVLVPKLGIDVGETSVGKYMARHRKPPSQTWRTFLENHVKTMVSVDFFTVPTIRFQVLYVFLVLARIGLLSVCDEQSQTSTPLITPPPSKALQPEHRPESLLHSPVVLFDHVIQILVAPDRTRLGNSPLSFRSATARCEAA